MKLSYRTAKNAEATARFWGKSLDKPDWFRIDASADDEVEILIYDVIGWPFIEAGEFVRALAEMKQQKIIVRINSPGGDVFDAMAIYNALQSHKSKIVTRIESLAASAASFIALAGKERQAYANTMIMVHEPFAFALGNQFDLREIADVLEKISGNMVDVYSSGTKLGKREIRDMMKAETWMNAKDAHEKGFIDSIIDGKAAKAAFDLSIFAKVPDCIEGQREGRDLTEREIERALRDAGGSRSFAKTLAALAGRRGDSSGDQRDVEGLKKDISNLISIWRH